MFHRLKLLIVDDSGISSSSCFGRKSNSCFWKSFLQQIKMNIFTLQMIPVTVSHVNVRNTPMTFSFSCILEKKKKKRNKAESYSVLGSVVWVFLNPSKRAGERIESICIDRAACLIMTAKSECMMETQRARDCRMKVDSQEISSHLAT